MKSSIIVQYFKQIKTGPLLAAFICFWLPIISFAKLANEVIENDTISYEKIVLYWIHGYSSPILDHVFYVFTSIGNVIPIVLMTFTIVAWLLYKEKYLKAFIVIACVGGAGVADFILKQVFHRDRPSLWHSAITETSYSFPSGHAMLSCALVLCIIFLLWNTRWRALTAVIGIFVISIIGLSRLYFGVHYPTDILAGWCVSIAWFAIVLALYARTKR